MIVLSIFRKSFNIKFNIIAQFSIFSLLYLQYYGNRIANSKVFNNIGRVKWPYHTYYRRKSAECNYNGQACLFKWVSIGDWLQMNSFDWYQLIIPITGYNHYKVT